MAIKIALHHRTIYKYDRPVMLGPHIVRLRPAPNCRTPIHNYSLEIYPQEHSIYRRQDVAGNYMTRVNLPNPTDELRLEVDLIAEMQPINPFEFLLEDYAAKYPFTYEQTLARELAPFLEIVESGSLLKEWVAKIDRSPTYTTNFLTDLLSRLHEDIAYSQRWEAGIHSCEETLAEKIGSCRDTSWLLVQICRHLGLAARFVSGYLIQLATEEQSPNEAGVLEKDTVDLHAWVEVYLPGAGWIGLDPTSASLTTEGHIPLASAAFPERAAPVSGSTEPCQSQIDFLFNLSRLEEVAINTELKIAAKNEESEGSEGSASPLEPYSKEQWLGIDALGKAVDEQLAAGSVRLTMGGEPTFVSIDDFDSPEWRVEALGKDKRRIAGILKKRLRDRFAPGALLHYGTGKWYPGETLPRWALGCYWRRDQIPIWRNPNLMAEDNGAEDNGAEDSRDYGFGHKDADIFIKTLVGHLGVNPKHILPACEQDRQLVAWVLPLLWINKNTDFPWTSCRWKLPEDMLAEDMLAEDMLPEDMLTLITGDSPAGFRLPLDSINWAKEENLQWETEPDPDSKEQPLGDIFAKVAARKEAHLKAQPQLETADYLTSDRNVSEGGESAVNTIKVALCVEAREGRLHVFIPPIGIAEAYLDLIACIENTVAELEYPVRIEGYIPPSDRRLQGFQITPDPGVIEANIHPAENWPELVRITNVLYEEASQSGLGPEKYTLDGRIISSGGGSHITIGGATRADSPLLRRPDLLQSLITYWQHHPSLSYLFAGEFIGPTSQSPRVDEARHETLYELEIAFAQLEGNKNPEPWVIDRLLRNLLVDASGNTHRTAFCIDKLYPVENPGNQLGLLELRSPAMSPHPRMSLLLGLLVRALVAWFWREPYQKPLVRWGTTLHDRFMLPYYIEQDLKSAIAGLQQAGYSFELEWFRPFFEFRFPRYGQIIREGITLELRRALEPWHVLGEQVNNGATARYVDSSMERIQVRLSGGTQGRHVVICNGTSVPLQFTGVEGEYVGGARYRARKVAASLHAAIAPHVPLVLDIVDTWTGRSLGGCQLHYQNPNGPDWTALPVNRSEAASRLAARFIPESHAPGRVEVPPVQISGEYPATLDLRRFVAPQSLAEE